MNALFWALEAEYKIYRFSYTFAMLNETFAMLNKTFDMLSKRVEEARVDGQEQEDTSPVLAVLV